jgi:hypothetical protein
MDLQYVVHTALSHLSLATPDLETLANLLSREGRVLVYHIPRPRELPLRSTNITLDPLFWLVIDHLLSNVGR